MASVAAVTVGDITQRNNPKCPYIGLPNTTQDVIQSVHIANSQTSGEAIWGFETSLFCVQIA